MQKQKAESLARPNKYLFIIGWVLAWVAASSLPNIINNHIWPLGFLPKYIVVFCSAFNISVFLGTPILADQPASLGAARPTRRFGRIYYQPHYRNCHTLSCSRRPMGSNVRSSRGYRP